jgi:transcriptional regulator with XRE-family HTH domain
MTSVQQIESYGTLIGNIHQMPDSDLPPLNPGKILNGDNIRRSRKAKGWTKTRLAQEIPVRSDKTIYNWEHGNNEPEGENRARLCEILDLVDPRLASRGKTLTSIAGASEEIERIRAQIELTKTLILDLAAQFERVHPRP